VGLVAFEAENGAPFNAEEHALPDGESAGDNATITQTRLPGFKLQGKLVRKPLVAVG
jgi:molecular chaperone GrpE (heat shock protein)